MNSISWNILFLISFNYQLIIEVYAQTGSPNSQTNDEKSAISTTVVLIMVFMIGLIFFGVIALVLYKVCRKNDETIISSAGNHKIPSFSLLYIKFIFHL